MGYNICVFCASSDDIPRHYFDMAKELGETMAVRGHTLVYGGGQRGLMGTVARGVHSRAGRVVGVIPRRADWSEVVYTQADDLIYTTTMRERKAIMESRADAFMVLPGGVGTFEEALEIITLRNLGYHTKPLVLVNWQGYYEPLLRQLDNSIEQGFAQASLRDNYTVTSGVLDSLETLERLLATTDTEGDGSHG